MVSYVLATSIADGFGDYVHFHDIVKAIQQRPVYDNVTFTLIVLDSETARESNKAQRIEAALQSLHLPYYHWTQDEWVDKQVKVRATS
jgi:hypothetical protein